MTKASFFAFILLILIACSKPQDANNISYLDGDGAFIVNEGNFMSGNGSIAFFSYDSAEIYTDLFETINERPLGDVPNAMVIHGDNAYIIVNNSGKIEVVNKNTLESVHTIDGLIAPRNMAIVGNDKAYVTSMYSDSLAVIRLSDHSIADYINIRRTSESLAVVSGKAFVSNWIGGDEVIVVNTSSDSVEDSIKVGSEPESMAIDRNNRLWVLCNGGWMRLNFASLHAVNTATYEIEKEFLFPTKQASPVSLNISGDGTTLFYLDGGVRKININASALPATSFISQEGSYFYKLSVNPVNGDIFITDAIDYQQQGFVLQYSADGTLVSKSRAGIIPGMLCFKLNVSQ